MDAKKTIVEGQATLGIEFGSTRIKAVLIDQEYRPIAQGSHTWENQLHDGLWTYSLHAIWEGLQSAYADLRRNVDREYGVEIERLAGIGVSAMMHGYMPFCGDELLVPFRTWRNTNTGEAARRLSDLFRFNIPLRWSISHLYQAILNGEEHIARIDFLTTLAGYIHWQLTGEKVLGVGDASGMLPVDPSTGTYNAAMVAKFDELVSGTPMKHRLLDILPKSLSAGAPAGRLTAEGAKKLDPSGHLQPGAPFCPPEGDAGTGMVATNAVRPRTGNVSAGTSSFSMIVLEKPLTQPYEQIDIVTTPEGAEVAMVHCNNCTSDINAWVSLFREFLELRGEKVDINRLYTDLFQVALKGETDCGGVLSYNYVSGEPVMGLADGRPMVVRTASDHFSLANFMRAQLYGAIGVLKVGNDILLKKEHVRVDRLTGHGGYFTTPEVGQRILAAALDSPISVMSTAGEGGPWGMALLAAFAEDKAAAKGDTKASRRAAERSLADFLDEEVFAGNKGVEIAPVAEDVEGFNRYIATYASCLPIEQKAVECKK